jgi:murein DD-endopeptidase MepM/ murein hydrolase activator NlpD
MRYDRPIYRQKKRGYLKFFIMIIFLGVVAGLFYIYNSSLFERDRPTIAIEDNIYWNLKKEIKVSLTDNSGIKYYKITFTDGKNRITLNHEILQTPKQHLEVSVKPPKLGMFFDVKNAKIVVEVVDASYWNFFEGNIASKSVNINIDTKKPQLFTINNNRYLYKGGSGVVIYKCEDETLDKHYVVTNFGKKFESIPFYKEGYYISLVAWPIKEKEFKASIVAVDKAGNKSSAYVPFYVKNRKYRISKIKLKDRFLDGKITQLYQDLGPRDDRSKIEKFKFVNEDLRNSNEDIIKGVTSQVREEFVEDFSINSFYPLKNAAKVASFGDHRFFYYNGELVSESYHMGLDLASVAMAKVKTQNSATTVYSDYNGIYGNVPILYHGLGLYSLYAHCSTNLVKKDEEISKGNVIAKTGKSGLALGDHLHFGIYVQGISVRPEEWMDKKWIKLNITDIINKAKDIIND